EPLHARPSRPWSYAPRIGLVRGVRLWSRSGPRSAARDRRGEVGLEAERVLLVEVVPVGVDGEPAHDGVAPLGVAEAVAEVDRHEPPGALRRLARRLEHGVRGLRDGALDRALDRLLGV